MCVRGIFRYIILVLTCSNISLASNLVFVNILFRHGARTPGNFYPNDPNQHNEIFVKLGIGQLTNQGREEHIRLGSWLHQRYSHLLSDPKFVHVQSTDVKRVIESAECNLAAMFPTHGSHHKDNKGVHCTTKVHIYTVKTIQDKVLAGGAPCPAYKSEYDSLMIQQQNNREKRFKPMFELLHTEAGLKPDQLVVKRVHGVYDALHVEKEDFNMKLPEWTKNVYPEPLKEATILRFTLSTWNDKMKRLGPGLLLHEMINNMESKANGKNHLNANIYAAHDYTIVNILNTLGVYDKKHLPPYAACVMLELWEEGQGKYAVKLYYKKSIDHDVEHLQPLKCGPSCSLRTFKTKCTKYIPKDWEAECHGNSNTASTSQGRHEKAKN